MHWLPPLNMFIYVGATLFLGFLLKLLLSDRFRFPAVTLYVIMGVALGTSALTVFGDQAVEGLGFISRLGVGPIAFIIGSEFDARTLRQLGPPIILIGILESLCAFVLVSAEVLRFYPRRPEYALILGAVSSAAAPAATVFVIRQFKAKGPLTSTIIGVVGFDDASSLVIFVFASLFAETMLSGQEVHVLQMIFRPLLTVVESIGLGLDAGGLAWLGLRKVPDGDNLMLGNRSKASLERLSSVLLPLF